MQLKVSKTLRTEPKQTFNYYNLARSYKNMGDNYKVRENYENLLLKILITLRVLLIIPSG